MGSTSEHGDFLERALFDRCCDPAVALLRAVEARLIFQNSPRGEVLDLGCGKGTFANGIFRPGQVWGLEINRRKAKKALKKPAYRTVVHADAGRLPFLANSVPNIVSNSALEHMRNAPEVLMEVGRVLAPGGMLLVTVHGSEFGEWTVCSAALERLGFTGLGRRYREGRFRRLAIHNRWPLTMWQGLIEKAGLDVVMARTYFPYQVEKMFEKLLSLSYLGIPHANLGAAARLAAGMLDLTGLRMHRRRLARFWVQRLRPYYEKGHQEGSCFLLLGKKR